MLEPKSSADLFISPGIHQYGLGVEEQMGVILNLRKALHDLKLQLANLTNLHEFRVPAVYAKLDTGVAVNTSRSRTR